MGMGQTDRRRTDGRVAALLNAPPPKGGNITWLTVRWITRSDVGERERSGAREVAEQKWSRAESRDYRNYRFGEISLVYFTSSRVNTQHDSAILICEFQHSYQFITEEERRVTFLEPHAAKIVVSPYFLY